MITTKKTIYIDKRTGFAFANRELTHYLTCQALEEDHEGDGLIIESDGSFTCSAGHTRRFDDAVIVEQEGSV